MPQPPNSPAAATSDPTDQANGGATRRSSRRARPPGTANSLGGCGTHRPGSPAPARPWHPPPDPGLRRDGSMPGCARPVPQFHSRSSACMGSGFVGVWGRSPLRLEPVGAENLVHLTRPGHTHGSARRVDPAAQPVRWLLDRVRGRLRRWRLTESAVRPVLVVVRHVARQHCLEMPRTQDQHPVEQLTTYGADPAFGERIRSRRPYRRRQGSDALRGEDRIEGVVNFASRSRMRNLNLTCSVRSAKSMSRLRACWATHAPVGFAVTPKT